MQVEREMQICNARLQSKISIYWQGFHILLLVKNHSNEIIQKGLEIIWDIF